VVSSDLVEELVGLRDLDERFRELRSRECE